MKQKALSLNGMVRFRNPSGKGNSHSQLMTFRVMMEGLKGWIRPAQPGHWPARTVGEQLQPAAEEIFRGAVAKDVTALLDGKDKD